MTFKLDGTILIKSYKDDLINSLNSSHLQTENVINLSGFINNQYNLHIQNNIEVESMKFEYGSFINSYIYIFIYKNEELPMLDLQRLGKIGVDRVKLYVNMESLNTDIIPNKISLGRVEDTNGLKILDRSTGEYIYINKYSYTSSEYIRRLGLHSFRYKIEIYQVQNPSKGISKYESILDTTAPRIRNEVHNIYNIHEKEDIELIFNTLEYELGCNGIYINLEDADAKEVEINKTFVWENSIADEEDILDYIFKVLRKDKSYKNKVETNKRVTKGQKESFTYSIGTHRMKIKIYTKSEQILNTIGYDCGNHLCRVELTLKKSAIKNSYGTNNISILKDTLKTKNIFLSHMNKKLIKPLISNFDKEIDKIESMIKGYNHCNYTTLDLVYKSISKELFDIVLLGIAALNVYHQRCNNNFIRDFKRLLKNVSNSHIGRYETLEKLISSIIDKNTELIHIPKKVKYILNEF